MEKEKYSEKLSRYILIAAAVLLIGFVCYYFSNVLIYIIIAGIVSLISRPIMKGLGKIRIKGKSAPKWLLAIVTLIILLIVFVAVITGLIPVISNVIREISNVSIDSTAQGIAAPLADLNRYLNDTFPSLGGNFRIEIMVIKEIQKVFDLSIFSSIIGSVASFFISFGIGIFSVLFIAFFFIKDETLFSRIVAAMTPDKLEKSVMESMTEVENLLSRYFVGLLIEMTGVALVNFLGLWLIARLNFEYAIGIAFLTGVLNIIPYVGPLMGEILGVVMGVTIKFCSTGNIGLDVSFWAFAAILLAILLTTQLIDNFVYQPVIYSNSIKASPLEIFIVLLVAGTFGGIVGMLAAIPAYTVVRVVLGKFFSDVKPIRKLIGTSETDKADTSNAD